MTPERRQQLEAHVWGRDIYIDDLILGELFVEIDRLQAKCGEWQEAEHALSDAYNRIRTLLNAFDTPYAPPREQVWQHTEDRLKELISEHDRITAIANKFARVEGSGPLACKKCGQSRGDGRHLSLEDCMRNRGGNACFAPEDHHPFVPGDPL